MNEWLKKTLDQLRQLWSKWTTVQKLILAGVIAAAVIGAILLVSVTSSPGMVPLLRIPITDQNNLDQITARLEQDNVNYTITADKHIMVPTEEIARRERAILVRYNLIPKGTSPWDIFNTVQWTQTDFERNVNLRRAITKSLEQHIEALRDVDRASVTLVMPQKQLFSQDQAPVTASVIIEPRPGSDITTNRQKIEGIQKLIEFAVEGLKPENITITDTNGVVLNDFTNLQGITQLDLTQQELKIKRQIEVQYMNSIYKALSNMYGKDRVQIPNINVQINLGKHTVQTQEYFPIVTVPADPTKPYLQPQFVLSIPRSTENFNENFQGSGFNPEGPPGQQGQTPPGYKDLQSTAGKYDRTDQKINNEVNSRKIYEEITPSVQRITVAVALDGTWKKKYNPNGQVMVSPDGSIERQYVPISPAELAKAQTLVQNAVGYDAARGDSVTVQNIEFDRSAQFQKEDDQYRRARELQLIILYALIGLAVLLVSFIAFRLISREIERRRRLREEELARQHAAMREAALRSAEEEGTEVEMSVEERARLELQESAINMAREHPEDVAQLIRTWLMEE
ncbi:MAG TPA: flagellar basal-body MS-ring/collar protein FliF [Spirochaetia bacterium]|nr:flagellar basal-body MS-ring/collar protein FliF [Spirochaetia bacterium]